MRTIEPVHPELKVVGTFKAIVIDPSRRMIENVAMPLYESVPGSQYSASSGHEIFKLIGPCTTSQIIWFPNGDHVDIEDFVTEAERKSRPSFGLYGRRCFSNALVNGWDKTDPTFPIVAPQSAVAELRKLVKWFAPRSRGT